MIRFDSISKKFPNQAIPSLQGIDLEIRSNAITALIGQSGAGKSTLLRLVNQLEKPTSGEIWLEKKALNALSNADLNTIRRDIGMVFQQFNLLNNKTVAENIGLPLLLLGEKKSQIKTRVDELCELVGLQDHKKSYPHYLSGGQKQRVAIARALANNPKILLLDEATASLDPETTYKILALILTIQKRLALTIIFVSHEIDFVKKLADDIVLLDQGKIIEVRNKFDFFLNPTSTIAQDYVFANFNKNIGVHFYPEPQSSTDRLLLRLTFNAIHAYEPHMSKLCYEQKVKFNILAAEIERIGEQPVGHLAIEIEPSQQTICFDYFKTHHIQYEILGYVHTAHS